MIEKFDSLEDYELDSFDLDDDLEDEDYYDDESEEENDTWDGCYCEGPEEVEAVYTDMLPDELEEVEIVDAVNYLPEDYMFDDFNENEPDLFDDSEELTDSLREVMHEDYGTASTEDMQEALSNILDRMSAVEGFSFKKALSQISNVGQNVLKDPTVSQIAGTVLPAAGTAVGGIYGGVLGARVGNELGSAAAQAFVGDKKKGPKPVPSKVTSTTSGGAKPVGKSSPKGGSTAAAQLLQLTQNTDVQKCLIALALGTHGKRSIAIGNNGKKLPVGGVMALISKLAREAAMDADELNSAGDTSDSDYLFDMEGNLTIDDPYDPVKRADALYEDLIDAENHRLMGTLITEGAVAGVGLGIAAFEAGKGLISGGAFRFSSAPARYARKKLAPYLPLDRVSFEFKVRAHHPDVLVSESDFWFHVSFEINGNDIKIARIDRLVDKSSNLIKSKFSIDFTPTPYSLPGDKVAEIRYVISGRWDPWGQGDVSIINSNLDIAADGSYNIKIKSERNWLKFKGFYNEKRRRLFTPPPPRPKTPPRPKRRDIYPFTVKFKPGSARLTPGKSLFNEIKSWYEGIPYNIREEVREGIKPIRLDGYASTTSSVRKNQLLAEKRAKNVQRFLRHTAGSNAKFDIFVHGELIAKTAQNVEDPKERRVDILITGQWSTVRR